MSAGLASCKIHIIQYSGMCGPSLIAMHEDSPIFGPCNDTSPPPPLTLGHCNDASPPPPLTHHEDSPVFGNADATMLEAAAGMMLEADRWHALEAEMMSEPETIEDIDMISSGAATIIADADLIAATIADADAIIAGANCVDTYADTIAETYLDTAVSDDEVACPSASIVAACDGDDLLLAWFDNKTPRVVEPIREENTWDSQLTQNDNPGERTPELAPLPCHFSQCPKFQASVEESLKEHGMRKTDTWRWLEQGITFNCLGPDWESNVNACTDAIANIVNHAAKFKIGICLDPHWRFFECGGRVKYEHEYKKMVLIYAAKSSKKWDSESTGHMEKILIDRFRHRDTCMNKAGGGGGASDGSPHFLYVVWE